MTKFLELNKLEIEIFLLSRNPIVKAVNKTELLDCSANLCIKRFWAVNWYVVVDVNVNDKRNVNRLGFSHKQTLSYKTEISIFPRRMVCVQMNFHFSFNRSLCQYSGMYFS